MDNVTALGAGGFSDTKTQNIIFISEEHKKFYSMMLEKSGNADCYHEALFYTLGINPDTRNHVNEIYDFEEGCIQIECIAKGWQTSSSLRVTRLAFNLYADDVPTTLLEKYEEDAEKQFNECRKYSVSDIFCCCYGAYFFQAIGLRYPEYVGLEGSDVKN